MRFERQAAGTKAEERWLLLSLRQLPARLSAEEAGWVLGCTRDEITILVAKKMLKPLGNPAINGRKYFAAAEVRTLADTGAWLDKATKVIANYWKFRNHGKPNSQGNTLEVAGSDPIPAPNFKP